MGRAGWVCQRQRPLGVLRQRRGQNGARHVSRHPGTGSGRPRLQPTQRRPQDHAASGAGKERSAVAPFSGCSGPGRWRLRLASEVGRSAVKMPGRCRCFLRVGQLRGNRFCSGHRLGAGYREDRLASAGIGRRSVQPSRESRAGQRDWPHSLRRYSTLGGTVG